MIYLFLADGFEEVEAMAPVDMLRRAGIELRTVSIQDTTQVCGAHQVCMQADLLFAQTDFADADMLILPGGMPGTTHLAEYAPLAELLNRHNAAGKMLAAICAAPSVLGNLGLLQGKKATCYPGFETALGNSYVDKPVVIDGNVITGKGAGVAVKFALALVAHLVGQAKADQVAAAIQCS